MSNPSVFFNDWITPVSSSTIGSAHKNTQQNNVCVKTLGLKNHITLQGLSETLGMKNHEAL